MNYRFEILKKITLETSLLTPYDPYVYQVLVTTGTLATYWTDTFGADIDFTNKIDRVVESVTIALTEEYTKYTTIADCIANEDSFYFDTANQKLYIHYNHDINPFAVLTEYSNTLGFTDNDIEYVSDVIYKPLLVSVPAISQTADPLQYGIMAYSDGTFTLINDVSDSVGLFDTDPLFVGMECRLKRDSVIQWVGRISTYQTTLDTLTINAVDKRKQLEVSTPTAIFSGGLNVTENDTKSVIIPDGYGSVIQVPAYPENTAGTGFRWATVATSISQVYADKGGVITAVSHSHDANWPLADGKFYLSTADSYIDANTAKGRYKIYVTGVMRPEVNPADIIADLNERLLSVSYDATNYNTTEWEAEQAGLADVSLYMDSTKKLTEWIELLQNGSDVGFRYEDISQRTIRLDDPTRSVSATISAVAIRNQDMPVDNNADLYATDALIKYGKNWRTGLFSQVTNTDYYNAVFREHRIPKTYPAESLLTSSTDADRKALLIMDDISKTRPIFNVVIDYASYTAPRIYDIIMVTFSFEDRAYYGSQRCQVIGISPRPETDEYILTLRQRDDSTVY